MKKKLAAFAALSIVGAASTQAASVTVPNFSFEDDVVADGTAGGAATGWTGGNIENHNTGIYGGVDASDGENILFNNLGGTIISTNAIGQIAEGVYTLNIDFLFRTDAISTDQMPNTTFGLTTDDGATILGVAGTADDSLDVGGAGAVITRTYTLNVGAGDAAIGQDYDIYVNFVDNGSGVWNQGAIDNVQLDFTAVPEPSSTALLGLGGLALILRRRK